jgi:hypothetical protein
MCSGYHPHDKRITGNTCVGQYINLPKSATTLFTSSSKGFKKRHQTDNLYGSTSGG